MKTFNDRDYADIMWEEMTWPEIRRKARQGYLAALPLGSIEQHGPMIPVGCDYFLARSWTLEGARRAKAKYGVKVIVLPAIPYGVSTEHIDFAGTVTLNLQTYIALLQDIIDEVIRSGFRKLACVSGHGGNMVPAQAALRDMKLKLRNRGIKGFDLYLADSGNCFYDANKLDLKQQYHFHASACETSYYLFQRPDLVRTKALKRPKLKRQSMPLGSWWTKDLTANGASGDPQRATADFGQRIYDGYSEAIAGFLKKVSSGRP